MASRASRRAARTSVRSRRTPARSGGAGRRLRIPWIPIMVAGGVVAVVALAGYLIYQAGQPASSDFDEAAQWEAEGAANPDLPGEYVNLPEIYADGSTLARYGANDGPNTNNHVRNEIDYAAEQGLPPAGGPHWGSGGCPDDPSDASPFCGPVPWGVYREAWAAESLVHNMEHGGVVIWYNTTDQAIISELEDIALDYLENDVLLVMAPYPEMEDETIAITAWARRDKFSVGEYSERRVRTFVDALKCKFNPESMPGQGC